MPPTLIKAIKDTTVMELPFRTIPSLNVFGGELKTLLYLQAFGEHFGGWA